MNDIIALIPVDRHAAQKQQPNSWDMPYAPLYRRLREKDRRRVLRSDDSLSPLRESPDEPFDLRPTRNNWSPTPGLKGVTWRIADKTLPGASQSPLYYDVRFEPTHE